jgi:hypothetical protein
MARRIVTVARGGEIASYIYESDETVSRIALTAKDEGLLLIKGNCEVHVGKAVGRSGGDTILNWDYIISIS